jgi:hypothetical protein
MIFSNILLDFTELKKRVKEKSVNFVITNAAYYVLLKIYMAFLE